MTCTATVTQSTIDARSVGRGTWDVGRGTWGRRVVAAWGVGCGACGCGFRGPKGLENLAQGLPWVFGLMPEALKGRPLTRR
jgi:hypothetical protein